ncbi:MAG: 5'/3'-nucleotidase SurE [Deltaproteobacteria bacterium]|nr:5'/3'-nucleotidase SurE [Deltaproteobacteria bacterium]
MEILLTNDDSHRSPLFGFIIDKLDALGRLTVVVPKEEQSWTGKSITRFKHLYVDEIRLFGRNAFCLDGTPADCINWGIYHLFEERRPDLVVSGINIGVNTGIGFALSSGTIGACLEANIASLPAVALSQDFDSASFRQWLGKRSLPEGVLVRLKEQTAFLLDRVFDHLQERRGFFARPVTWNINLPFAARGDWRLIDAYLGHTWYASCFRRAGDRFYHDLDPPREDPRAGADGAVVRSGHVSITEIDIRNLGRSPAGE